MNIEQRYIVKLVRGIAMGAGMFAVIDTHTGNQIGESKILRDDADKIMNRMNNEPGKNPAEKTQDIKKQASD